MKIRTIMLLVIIRFLQLVIFMACFAGIVNIVKELSKWEI